MVQSAKQQRKATMRWAKHHLTNFCAGCTGTAFNSDFKQAAELRCIKSRPEQACERCRLAGIKCIPPTAEIVPRLVEIQKFLRRTGHKRRDNPVEKEQWEQHRKSWRTFVQNYVEQKRLTSDRAVEPTLDFANMDISMASLPAQRLGPLNSANFPTPKDLNLGFGVKLESAGVSPPSRPQGTTGHVRLHEVSNAVACPGSLERYSIDHQSQGVTPSHCVSQLQITNMVMELTNMIDEIRTEFRKTGAEAQRTNDRMDALEQRLRSVEGFSKPSDNEPMKKKRKMIPQDGANSDETVEGCELTRSVPAVEIVEAARNFQFCQTRETIDLVSNGSEAEL